MAERPEVQFSRNARDYRHEPLFAAGADLARMVAAVALAGTEALLDVGTGAGHTALAFAPRLRAAVGLDATVAMVREAADLASERGVRNACFLVGRAEDLPFPDATFDLVTCRFAAHHFSDVGRALAEVARVLRPGGTFLLVDHYAPEDAVLDAFVNRLDGLRDPSHVREYRLSEHRALFAAAGLGCREAGRWDLPLDFANWVERARVPAARRQELAALLREAPAACRSAFAVQVAADGRPRSFALKCALLRGDRGEVRGAGGA